MKYIVAACVVLGGFLLTLLHTPAFADNAKYPESILPGKEHPQEQKDHSPVQQHHARQTITLDEAIRLAISHNPGLAAAIHEMKARVGAAQQDAMLPNPVLVAEFEEFGGSGIYSGTDVMTSSIGISQEILLGGKLSVRKLLAEEIRKQTILENDAQLVTLSSEVGKKFIDVYIAQEKLKLARNDLQLTLASAEAISKRVASGEASPLEKTKFSVETAAAETTVKRVARILQAARLALAATWGSAAADFAGVADDFLSIPSLDHEEQLLKQLKNNPTYRLLTENVTLAENKFQLAKAEAVPDIEIGGGIQQFKETNDHAYFLDVSIPLPLINRNQGGIAAAQATLNQTKKEKEAGMLELQTNLMTTISILEGVWGNYLAVRNVIVPASEQVFASVQKAYRLGEQDYLELLEAQRSLLKARNEHLELLAEFWQLKLEVAALVGQPIFNGQQLLDLSTQETGNNG